MPMTPDRLFALWSELTGQQFRIKGYTQQREAQELCDAGFTEDDVRLTLIWIKKRLAREDSGFNQQSLLWRVNAADGWAKFQERLSLAQEAAHRASGAKPRPQVPVTTETPAGSITRLAEQPPDDAKIVDVRGALRGLADDIDRRAQA